MTHKLFSFLILISVFVILVAQSQIKSVDLELDKPLQNQEIEANTSKNYTIASQSLKIQGDNQYLYLIVEPTQKKFYEKTEIKIFRHNMLGRQVILADCSDVGIDLCFLNKTIISQLGAENLYVRISCNQQEGCAFNINLYWDKSYPLKLDKQLSLDFEDTAYAKHFILDISNEPAFKELRIMLRAKTFLQTTDPIHLFVNYDHNGAPQKGKADFQGTHIWDDGQGVFIEYSNLKSKKLRILVEGPAENKLILQASSIKQYLNHLTLNLPSFDHLKKLQNRKYLLNFTNNTKACENDIYVKVSAFTGSLNVQIFEDEAQKKQILTEPFSILGDSQYKIGKSHRQEKKMKNQLYVVIGCRYGECTFMMNGFFREENIIRLNQDIVEISQLNSNEIDFYYLEIFARKKSKQRILEKLIVNTIKGNSSNVKTYVSICSQDNVTECLPPTKKYDKSLLPIYNTVKPKDFLVSGTTISYNYQLDIEKFQKTENKRINKLILLIMIVNQGPVTLPQIKYSVTFIDQSSIGRLRQNRPISQRMSMGQIKYYRFINRDKDVKQIRFHLIGISGRVNFSASRKDPRLVDTTTEIQIFPVGNVLVVDEKVTDPIFVSVYSQQNSLFSLTTQVIRGQQKTDNQKQNFNYVLIPMDIQHNLILSAKNEEILVFFPTVTYFQIQISSMIPVQICGSYKENKKPFPPNCDFQIKNSSYRLNNTNMDIVYIGIRNPNDKNAYVSIKYTDATTCDQKRPGDVWSKLVTPYQKACVTYNLLNHQKTQILVNLLNLEYTKTKMRGIIGDIQLEIDSAASFLEKKDLQNHCLGKQTCQITIVVQSPNATVVQIVVQGVDKDIALLDGIAQKITGIYGPNTLKKFKFVMPNKKNATIMLESKIGFFSFYVNILNMTGYNLNTSYPTRQKHNLASKNLYYSLYNSITITQNELKEYKCTVPCLLLISVYHNGDGIEQRGTYYLQATQQVRYLKQHSQAVGYLDKHSLAYYGYYYPKEDGSIIISLSTQTLSQSSCAKVYLSKGQYEKATSINNLGQQIGYQMIYPAKQPGMYSITVEAEENCQYTISVSSSKIRLYELNTAVYKDIKLKTNQTALFYYNSLFNESFKLLSIEEEGEVLISANTINSSQFNSLDKYNKTQDMKTNSFQWHNQPNVLRISTKDVGYCYDCYYIFAVKALRQTQTSLIIYTNGTQIPLAPRKIVNDKLDQGQTIRYRLFANTKECNMTIKLYYGEINITVETGKSNQSKTFRKTSQDYQVWMIFNDSTSDDTLGYAFYKPIHVTVTAKAATLYELSISTNENPYQSKKLKMGYPNYIFLPDKSTDPTCLSGTIKSEVIKLIVSTGNTDKLTLSNLQTKLYINDKQLTNFDNRLYENTRLLNLNIKDNIKLMTEPANKYKICFISDKSISLTIVPVSNITFFEQSTSYLVERQQNLTLSPQGKMILEVFECSGTASILLSSNFNKLNGTESQIMHWRKFGQNYVVQLQHWGPTYLNVKGELSLIKWIHVNQQLGEGIGYYSFRIPHYRYRIQNGKNIVFLVEPINKLDNSDKFKILAIKYTLMIGNSQKELKSGSQCGMLQKVTHKNIFIATDFGKIVEFKFNQQQLERFSGDQYIFSYVVAEVEVMTKSQIYEVYKFIYDEQQITWNIKLNEEDEIIKKTSGWKKFMIFLLCALIGVILFLVGKWLYTRVKNYKARTSSLNFNEQGGDMEMKYSFAT